MDRREHHRVQLRIPARLRWTTPFGQKTEVCETLNVCRGGVLVPCGEAHAPGATLWVTFPYDATVPYGQPEILARVVRSGIAECNGHATRGNGSAAVASAMGKNSPTGNGADEHAHGAYVPSAALRFEIAPHPSSNGNGHREVERRSSARRPLAVPVRVRLEHVPWFEETMTMDISGEGLRFLSNREYQPRQHLIVAFEPGALSPWPGAAENQSVVVRADAVPQSSALAVAVYRLKSSRS